MRRSAATNTQTLFLLLPCGAIHMGMEECVSSALPQRWQPGVMRPSTVNAPLVAAARRRRRGIAHGPQAAGTGTPAAHSRRRQPPSAQARMFTLPPVPGGATGAVARASGFDAGALGAARCWCSGRGCGADPIFIAARTAFCLAAEDLRTSIVDIESIDAESGTGNELQWRCQKFRVRGSIKSRRQPSWDDIGRDARSRRLLRPRLPAPEQAKPFPVPAKHGLGLHEQQRVAPSWKRSREQRDQRTLVSPEDRSLHLPACHDELLAQKDILHRQFGPRTQQVSRETTDDRARPWTQCFADNLRRAYHDRLQFGDGTSEQRNRCATRTSVNFRPLPCAKYSTIATTGRARSASRIAFAAPAKTFRKVAMKSAS